MAQAPAQPIPTWISLLEARELVTQRYLSPAPAGKLLVEWLNNKHELVRWRYEYIENNSGLPDSVGLNRFWRPGVSISWEESRAARKVEPRTVAGRMAPGGIVRMSHPRSPPVSQLGNPYNFFVYGIRVAREDILARLPQELAAEALPQEIVAEPSLTDATSVPPTVEPGASTSASTPSAPAPAAVDQGKKPKDWLRISKRNHPKLKGERHRAWAERQLQLMRDAHARGEVRSVWSLENMIRRLRDKDAED